jgi:glycosyltransferase involved in cell wall biosynthesis
MGTVGARRNPSEGTIASGGNEETSGATLPLVTVIVPTFNRAHMIRAAIDSVRNQTYPNWDLVIVNDRSTDNTLEVIQPYLEADKRIRCVPNSTYAQGCGGARSRGVDEIRGEYVAFLDTDDTWPEYHLEEHVKDIQANPDIDWIFGDLRRINEEGQVVVESKFREGAFIELLAPEIRGNVHVLKSDGLVENFLRHGIPAAVHTSLIRSEVFRLVHFRDAAGFADDRLFALEAAAKGARFAFVNKIHLNYLVHRGNISGANTAPTLDHSMKVNKAVEQYYAELVPRVIPMTPLRRQIVKAKLADHFVWEVAHNVLRPSGKKVQALSCILRGIMLSPWKPMYWKTLVGTLVR